MTREPEHDSDDEPFESGPVSLDDYDWHPGPDPDEKEAALRQRCRDCGAQPGEDCRDGDGEPMRYWHEGRLEED